MIRACPSDHPCVVRSKNHHEEGEPPLVLMSMRLEVDPHFRVVPQSFQNFITRTVLGTLFLSLLHVAEDVRDGKRPMHKAVIDEKRELYDWIEQRVGVLIDNSKERNNI